MPDPHDERVHGMKTIRTRACFRGCSVKGTRDNGIVEVGVRFPAAPLPIISCELIPINPLAWFQHWNVSLRDHRVPAGAETNDTGVDCQHQI